MASFVPSGPVSGRLSSFPFLTPGEFDQACQAFCDRSHVWQFTDPGACLSIHFVHQPTSNGSMLKLSRHIENANAQHHEDATIHESDTVFEHDPEALIRPAEPNTLLVDYDVVLSPVYQVPVLYFTLQWTNHQGPKVGIDEVYQYLVPEQFRRQLKNVGIMGGISFDYHPVSGTPAFFVHPCYTADAMRSIAGNQEVTPEAYFLIWLGLVGHCVGLHLPPELFSTEAGTKIPERLGQQT